jgi:hypothetical protein
MQTQTETRVPARGPLPKPNCTKKKPQDVALVHKERNDGKSERAIAKAVGFSRTTVRKILKNVDPDQKLVDQLIKNENADLVQIGALARNNLFYRFTTSSPNVIESTAVMDRAFSQRRLLGGQSTQNVAIEAIATIKDEREAVSERIERLESLINGK